ncbi:sugar ABC transporter permease [Ferrovibrio sp. MS7]|jgi:multiple sugar transport system permease protein|uniref:carbohydrate ABC transporter permease n=1 Tax=Ferrovibrio plantarum TaxID=3119164 RepID=UPI003135FBAB
MRRPDFFAYMLLAPVHLLLLAVIALPSLYVLWLSLNQSGYGTGLEFVGLANYYKIFEDRYFWRASLNTFIVVNAVVYAEIVLGLALAALFVRGVPLPRLMFAIVLMPYAVSEVVGVLTWKMLMDPNFGTISRLIEELGLGRFNWSVAPYQGLTLISVISVWHNLPFTFLLLYAGMLAIPQSVYEAAKIDGATPWQTFTRITLPLMVPSILVAIIFRLVFAFRIFSEVWLLTKGGPARFTEVLAVYLYQAGFRFGDFGVASATGWVMVIGSLLIASIYLREMHKRMVNKHA